MDTGPGVLHEGLVLCQPLFVFVFPDFVNNTCWQYRKAVTLSPCPFLTDLYCTLEVDSFGYFVNKAKTRVYRDTTEPNWNEVRSLLPPGCFPQILISRGSLRASPKESLAVASIPGIS